MITYEGTNCTAVLDKQAGTLTLTHKGFTAQGHLKKSSPWVIPLGAIAGVDQVKGSFGVQVVRVRVYGRPGWDPDPSFDPSCFTQGKGGPVEPFIDAINAARAGFAPTDVLPAAPVMSAVDKARLSSGKPVPRPPSPTTRRS